MLSSCESRRMGPPKTTVLPGLSNRPLFSYMQVPTPSIGVLPKACSVEPVCRSLNGISRLLSTIQGLLDVYNCCKKNRFITWSRILTEYEQAHTSHDRQQKGEPIPDQITDKDCNSPLHYRAKQQSAKQLEKWKLPERALTLLDSSSAPIRKSAKGVLSSVSSLVAGVKGLTTQVHLKQCSHV